jgi:hypothetical protein
MTFDPKVSLGDIATLTAAFIGMLALLFAYFQVREAKRQRLAQSTQHAFELLSSKESRENRRYVYNEIPPSIEPEELTPAQWARIEDYWVDFERVAQYIKLGLVDRDSIVRMYSFGLIAGYTRLQPYVAYQGRLRGSQEVFLSGYRELVWHAEDYWRKSWPNVPLPKLIEWQPGYRNTIRTPRRLIAFKRGDRRLR